MANPRSGNSAMPTQAPITMPGIPASFPEINSLEAAELTQLLANEEKYKEFLTNLDYIKNVDELKKRFQMGNVNLAKKVLEKGSHINQLKSQCQVIRGELAGPEEHYKLLVSKLNEVQENCSVNKLLIKLQASVSEINKESELLKEKFVKGEIEWNDFSSEFKRLRKVYHVRHQTYLAALLSLTSSSSPVN